MARYEVEIKSLLGTPEKAEILRERMKELDPSCACTRSYTQLNHYFEHGNPQKLLEIFSPLFSDEQAAAFSHIVKEAKKISVRTREMDGIAKLVLKASIDDTTSENGISRIEFEEDVEGKTLEEVDELVQSAGYTYQAKWSRTREEYTFKNANVCLDKNAGYGYLAELERVVDDESEVFGVKGEIIEMMDLLGLEELPQDRLTRMFDFYNANWSDYYGTDKIFVIE